MCKDVYEDGKVRLYASYSSQSDKMRFNGGGRYKRSSFRSVYCFNLEKIKKKELFYVTVPCYILKFYLYLTASLPFVTTEDSSIFLNPFSLSTINTGHSGFRLTIFVKDESLIYPATTMQ